VSLPRPRPAWFGLDRILARIFPGFLLPLAETAETYPILLLALAQDLDPFKVGPGTGLLPRGPASLPERTRRTVREPAPPRGGVRGPTAPVPSADGVWRGLPRRWPKPARGESFCLAAWRGSPQDRSLPGVTSTAERRDPDPDAARVRQDHHHTTAAILLARAGLRPAKIPPRGGFTSITR